MADKDRTVLKGYFNTGDIPTESNFSDLVDTMTGRTFYPEDYGAVGDGSTDDTAAIQAAIDAASVSGGRVVLSRVYNITRAGITDLGMYEDIDYALWVNADNVFVEGPGTLIMTELPSTTAGRFAMIAFGNGGTANPLVPPGETGTWVSNVGIRGVTFDMSAFTKEQLITIGNSLLSGNIIFTYCRYFFIETNIIINGYGLGAICTHASSKYGTIKDNKIYGASGLAAMWLDGIRCSHVKNNSVVGEHLGVTYDINNVGINLAANTDNFKNCDNNVVAGNNLINCKGGGISAIGTYNNISNNSIYTIQGGYGIQLFAGSSVSQGEYQSSYNRIIGNVIDRNVGNTYGDGIIIIGEDASVYNGTPNPCDNNVIMSNYINAGWVDSIHLDQSATNNVIVGNVLKTPINYAQATATGNTVDGNYIGTVQHFNVKSYGAKGDGATDDSARIQAAIDAADAIAGAVIFPAGVYRFATTLTITDRVQLIGESIPARWPDAPGGSASASNVILEYTGAGVGINIHNTTDDRVINGVTIENIELRPSVSGAGTNGIFIDASVVNECIAVTGVVLKNVTVRNWGNDGIQTKGTIFDTTFDRVSVYGNVRYGVYFDGTGAQTGTSSQITFNDCWLWSVDSASSWAVRMDVAETVRFMGGTVAGAGAGNGAWLETGATVIGTNIEGVGTAGTIGVRYVGANGLFLGQGHVSAWDIGVQIGNPDSKAEQANGWVISAEISGNTTDLHVVDGGSRVGSVLNRGRGNTWTVDDDRATVDEITDEWSYLGTANH